MDPGRIEKRHVRVRLSDQQADFSAAQDDTLGAHLSKLVNDLHIGRLRLGFTDSQAQFTVDDIVNLFPVRFVPFTREGDH